MSMHSATVRFGLKDIVVSGNTAVLSFTDLGTTGAAASSLVLHWQDSRRGTANSRVPTRNQTTEKNVTRIEVARDDLIIATSAAGRPEGATSFYWAFIDPSGGRIVAQCRTAMDADEVLAKVQTPPPGAAEPMPGRSHATGDARARTLSPIVLLSGETHSVNLAERASVRGVEVHAELHPGKTVEEASAEPDRRGTSHNGGHVSIDADSLPGMVTNAAFVITNRQRSDRVIGSVSIVRVSRWMPGAALAAALLLGATAAWAYARSTLKVDDVGISIGQGQSASTCARVEKPERAQVWLGPVANTSDLKIELVRAAPTADCPSGHRLKATAAQNLPPQAYRAAYGASFQPGFLGSREGTVTVHVGEGPILEPVLERFECIKPSDQLTVNLADRGRVVPRGFDLSVRSMLVQLPLSVNSDPADPLRKTLVAPPPPHGGELVYEFRLVAGGLESRSALIRVNNPQRCPGVAALYGASTSPRQPPLPANPKQGFSEPPSQGGRRATQLDAVVPSKGGAVLAYGEISLNQTWPADLPVVQIEKVPQGLKATVAGQFILVEGRPAGQREQLSWSFQHAGTIHTVSATITYQDLCVDATERLVYLPKGRYYLPGPQQPSEEQGIFRRFRDTLFVAGSDDHKRGSFLLDPAICLQAQEQGLGSLRSNLPSILSLVRAAEIEHNIRQQSRSSETEDVLRFISYDDALRIADWKTSHAPGGKRYWIPRGQQWLSGLILAAQLRGTPAGAALHSAALHASYVNRVAEWIDAQPGPTDPHNMMEVGPTGPADAQVWARRTPRHSRRATLSVRFARAP